MTKNRPQHASVDPRSVFLAMIGALLLCFALAISAARASDPPVEAPVSSVPAPLLKNFAIFRTSSEVVPPEIAKAAATFNAQPPSAGGHGFNAALGQEVVLPGRHAPLWAVPGRDQVMLWDQPRESYFGGTTTTISRAVKRGVIFWSGVPKTHDPHLVRVKGLVPDGITGVRLSKRTVAPVIDNAFTRKIDQAKLWEKAVLLRGARASDK